MDAEEAADLVRAMEPASRFRCTTGTSCAPSQADVFRKLAAPVPVQVLDPTNPFEQP